uniref:Uncharacterized protein n=1 Tax=Arundo donax TaxID=35708 RepID=A0A0A9C018_ARUDO
MRLECNRIRSRTLDREMSIGHHEPIRILLVVMFIVVPIGWFPVGGERRSRLMCVEEAWRGVGVVTHCTLPMLVELPNLQLHVTHHRFDLRLPTLQGCSRGLQCLKA